MNSEDKLKNAFIRDASKILKSLDALIDKYNLRDEVIMACGVGVEIYRDDDDVAHNAFFCFNLGDDEDLDTMVYNMYETFNNSRMDKGLNDLLNPLGISLN